MLTIIGERLNMTRARIKEEVGKRNSEFVREEAKKQVAAGATHIDINAGGEPGKEVNDLRWLTEVVREAVEVPLVFDSTNAEAIEEGLKLCKRNGTIINSVTAEKERLWQILPVVKKYEADVIALTMDDEGVPEDLDRRIQITECLVETFKKEGIGLERVYFDHLVRPASTNPGQARFILDAITFTKKTYPDAHIAIGLSNISYGLPGRNNLNRAFLAMLIGAGCDGFIFDPCEPGMMSSLLSSRAIMGNDEYGIAYISAHREGKL